MCQVCHLPGIIPRCTVKKIQNIYSLRLLQGGRYSLLVLVPNSRSGLSQLISDLAGYSLRNVQKHLQLQEVEVCLPCFEIQTTTKPIDSLKKVRIVNVTKNQKTAQSPRLKSQRFSEAKSASIFIWNGKEGKTTQIGPTELVSLSTHHIRILQS